MKVTLPDDTARELPDGASGADLAREIGPGLAKAALAVRVNGRVADLAAPLPDGERVEIVTDRSPDALDLIRHDTAHVMATAVMELYPGTKISIGPPIENGFYYDFEFPEGVKVSDEDLGRIEERMREHIAADEPFERTDISVEDAGRRFAEEGQDYKVELIRDLVSDEGVEAVSLYRNGPFTDLCRGPHAPSTGRIKAFKLLSVAGAYWRGDERNKMLTRIYGTAFLSKQDLEHHLEMLEQARARDHRRLGPQLGLFVLREEAPGMPFYLPNGTVVVNEIQRVLREHLERGGYGEIRTPQILDVELWKRSGHWDNYRENMFFTQSGEDGRQFAVKPMNCPGACLVYASERHSYRDLPLRLGEFGLCTRNEREGVLHGLLRVRAFTQDDGHVFCTEDQIVPRRVPSPR
jgi:threonyl-tRNA synthetase